MIRGKMSFEDNLRERKRGGKSNREVFKAKDVQKSDIAGSFRVLNARVDGVDNPLEQVVIEGFGQRIASFSGLASAKEKKTGEGKLVDSQGEMNHRKKHLLQREGSVVHFSPR